MRAGLSQLMPYIKKDMAYLFIARRSLVGKSSDFCKSEMSSLLVKAGLLDEKSC
jgi:hypothetical protein